VKKAKGKRERANLLRIYLIAKQFSQRPSDLLFPKGNNLLKITVDNLIWEIGQEDFEIPKQKQDMELEIEKLKVLAGVPKF
jgi:hypothetical protein